MLWVRAWRGDLAAVVGREKLEVWQWRRGVPHEVFMRSWISGWG